MNPIEAESMRIIRQRADLSHLGPLARAVVERVVHATADFDFVETMVVDEVAARTGAEAIAAGATVVCDTRMVASGVTGVDCVVAIDSAGIPEATGAGAIQGVDTPPRVEAPAGGGSPAGALVRTRSAEGIRAVAASYARGAVWVVGCAPTALFELVGLCESGEVEPVLVVGTPVGFVGAAESKERLRAAGIPQISNVGEKGGSAVAAAVVNALVRWVSDSAGGAGDAGRIAGRGDGDEARRGAS